MRREIPTYADGPTQYLELHARRAPIFRDGFYAGMTEADVENATQNAVAAFQDEQGVELFQLGRSGRHVCVEDTPDNRKHFQRLQRAANNACDALFESFRNCNSVRNY